MQSLAIMKPFPIVSATTSFQPGASQPQALRAFSPDPKEAFVIPAVQNQTVFYLTVDFGSVMSFDSYFIGYHTALGITSGLEIIKANGDTVSVPFPGEPLEVLGYSPPSHTFRRLSSPVLAQTVRLGFVQPAGHAPVTIGVIAIGLAWQAQWGTEWGSGRLIEDTGTAERLFGGGFGIDDGVAAGGYQWTFGDLQAEELRTLYQIVKDRRTTRSVLVVEDPEQTDGLNERIHWGLFRKIDAYERLDPANTKWSLQIGDWA